MTLDALVIAAHPDDAEIALGGTMLLLARAGKRVGVVDLTRGELGSRGTEEDREAEARAASDRIGLALRANLELPDGRVQVSVENRERLARLLREHKPQVVFAHHEEDLHPDHAAAGTLARQAWYLSGLRRLAELDGGPAAARPARLYHFPGHVPFEATFVVDVGSVWEAKRELVGIYGSQLQPQGAGDRGEHFLFGADILQRMESKARYWGERIGAHFGEPLLHRGPLPFSEPLLGL
jgi:bacillithiol biosynthesis deacetylase BshB1